MPNPGEEICGEWLRHKRGCDFISYNVNTTEQQGEIDVVGINLAKREVYACEVATHMITGLQYTRNSQPDNVDRFVSKFRKGNAYLCSGFGDWTRRFMLWSPVVREPKPSAKHSQTRDLVEIATQLSADPGIVIECIVNQRYAECLRELRAVAGATTEAMPSGIMRFLQIEEHLKRHLARG